MDSIVSQPTFAVALLVIVLPTLVTLFGFAKRLNEWYYIDRVMGEMKHSLPPGDMGWPIIGNTLCFLKAFKSNDPEKFINNMIQKYGRTGIYKSYIFGSPSVIVCAPETCKKVLTDDEKFVIAYSKTIRELTGTKLHDASGGEHRRLRKLLVAPINGHEALALYVGYIEGAVIATLEEWSRRDRPFEFLIEMEKLTFKVFTRIFLGTDVESIRESMQRHNDDFHDGFFAAAFGVPGMPFRKALRARKKLVKILQNVLNERRGNKIGHRIQSRGMIDILMEVEDDNGKKFSDDDIYEFLLSFLVAGYRSIAYIATWITIHLYSNPQVLLKAKEEQEEILKRRPCTHKGFNITDIRQMEYLSKVIDETLRMITLTFASFRKAQDEAYINGYLIPKGWKVLVWSRAVHMDPEVHVNPEEFIPSRWDNQKPKVGPFLAFGGGRRTCPGADFSKLQLFIFLHYFLLNYKLEQVNPGAPTVYLPVPRPSDNCLAKVLKLP